MSTLHHSTDSVSPVTDGGRKEISAAPGNERKDVGRNSSASTEMVDLESGLSKGEIQISSTKTGRDCRICHLSIDATNQDPGTCFELGCSCKDDLGAAHKQCAETWFKIKGNKTCEICGTTARNVSCTGMNTIDSEIARSWTEAASTVSETAETVVVVDRRRLCHRHRFLNLLVACMVFAFIVSWLFHFKIRP